MPSEYVSPLYTFKVHQSRGLEGQTDEGNLNRDSAIAVRNVKENLGSSANIQRLSSRHDADTVLLIVLWFQAHSCKRKSLSPL